MNTRNLSDMSPAERSAVLWLNIDDLLTRTGIGRSQLYKLIQSGEFPAPYKWKGSPLWTQADVSDWITRCVKRSSVDAPRSQGEPVTWASIRRLLSKSKPAALTNKQIAHLLRADLQDVQILTRLIAKAGEIESFKPLSSSQGSVIFYSAKIKERRLVQWHCDYCGSDYVGHGSMHSGGCGHFARKVGIVEDTSWQKPSDRAAA